MKPKLTLPFVTDERLSFSRYARGKSKIYRPTSSEHVRLLFDMAAENPKDPKRVTIRGAGHSFDGQAVHKGDKGKHIVIETIDYRGAEPIRYHGDNPPKVTLAAGLSWKEFLEDSLQKTRLGNPLRIPGSMQTGGQATVGGTLAGDCLSRFSGTLGKESEWIDSFRIITPLGLAPGDGLTDISARGNYSDLFHAVIGGLGFIGFVTEATYRLIEVPCDAVAHTKITITCTDIVDLLQRQRDLLNKWNETDGKSPLAVSSAGFHELIDGSFKGGVFCSWYGSPSTGRVPAWPLYEEPDLPGRSALEYAVRFGPLNAFIHSLLFKLASKHQHEHFENAVSPFVFFMDGNALAKEAYEKAFKNRRLFPIFQQTWVIPDAKADRFARELERLLRDPQTPPLTEFDALFVKGNKCFMSAAFCEVTEPAPPLMVAFTLAWERWTLEGKPDRPPAGIAKTCERLNDLAVQYGGRIHLVKNVHVADQTQFGAMFAKTLPKFLKVKNEHDPTGILRNNFFDELFTDKRQRRRVHKR